MTVFCTSVISEYVKYGADRVIWSPLHWAHRVSRLADSLGRPSQRDDAPVRDDTPTRSEHELSLAEPVRISGHES